MIELFGFKDNIDEFNRYVEGLGKPLHNLIVAYHPAGIDGVPDAQIYASEGLGEAALVPGFVEAFGDSYDGSMPSTFELVEAGSFQVIETADAFDLEIPAINVAPPHSRTRQQRAGDLLDRQGLRRKPGRDQKVR